MWQRGLRFLTPFHRTSTLVLVTIEAGLALLMPTQHRVPPVQDAPASCRPWCWSSCLYVRWCRWSIHGVVISNLHHQSEDVPISSTCIDYPGLGVSVLLLAANAATLWCTTRSFRRRREQISVSPAGIGDRREPGVEASRQGQVLAGVDP